MIFCRAGRLSPLPTPNYTEIAVATILFVNSLQPEIDRGWKPDDVLHVLAQQGHTCVIANVETRRQLETLISPYDDPIVWPVCYTIGPEVDGLLLTAALEQMGILYVGASATSLALNSKLEFKAALAQKTPYQSPAYYRIESLQTFPTHALGYPAVLKTEFSCNSEGVCVIDNQNELKDKAREFTKRFGQRLLVEKWERQREFTVAYFPPVDANTHSAAALEFHLMPGYRYIDARVKSDNSLLRFSKPEASVCHSLEDTATQIAKLLAIDGHFRMDFVANAKGQIFPIEVNFLPFLTRYPPHQSYFPLAFEVAGRSYDNIIDRLLNYSRLKRFL
jgi:D-alanine-D-alanine ligase-like ATP-grasp enzyme